MDESAKITAAEDFRKDIESMKSVSDKHPDLLRAAARHYSLFRDAVTNGRGKYALVRNMEASPVGIYDKPMPCFGCGIGWFSFLLGFIFPLMWYYATILYLGNHYRKDPRERAGLAASAIAAMGFSVVLLIVLFIRLA